MLTSRLPLDSTFSNPCPSLSDSSSADLCFSHKTSDPKWHYPPGDIPRTSPIPAQQKDCPTSKKVEEIKPPKAAMNCIEPEDDLNILISNARKLQLCGYYYGNLSWVDASAILRHCKVGTFLVRDSEHGSYLYTLSVQTRKGPTSCRIDYTDGLFRLDSAKGLSHKMPLFDCVLSLIDYYVHLSRHWPLKNSKTLSPVWLDMDESNSTDVPVQIYKPLYRQMRSLQHLCRVTIVKSIKESESCCKTAYRTTQDPSVLVSRTLDEDPQYKNLPNMIKNYLVQYPYTQ
ncbi:suppressor of cytokine signaling 2-like [Argiope bruennichi]|uniref:Suppressor of cytokine signaling 2 like protein n=1 Tax=Argiope bruennichi TaxID=94029 RepID=A0A8T0FNK0_ARGBR|nr:suppressor of cytokine signaling 2-like [Argiope bruennichi]XP_055938950.1 suppressor of cytokine signaling 2-like [Argiope bruennichi]XP_055938951.1 suppressor of cytokine signaling 2-like [Argiope bruennichi]XP_055938952.1 suppressor of cytokine signaling 2-like [Argiope bruennichi]XP_055938953.1 suppressor of cytokine signaling 2-like [Argiope bruennichi]KAF8791925.1 Suppressor of cytokine signaling 2 like protein [Argiope bruennichi]